MDAHRLRSVIDRILDEHSRLGIDGKFAQIIQALGTCVSEPSSASDEQFRVALTDTMAALRRSRTNDFVESDRRIVIEIEAERFTGHGLAERLLDLANERPFLAGRARERFIEIADALQRFISACSGAQSALQTLHVGSMKITSDEYELGIMLPDSVLNADLGQLIKELKEWNQILGELVPALNGKPPSVMLRAFSTRRFELAARLDRPAAVALCTVIAGIYAMFDKIKENRDRADDLERNNYPHDIVGRIKDYEKQIAPQEMKAIREVATTRFLRGETGRRKDLEKILDRGLQFLAVKIRDGAAVEIVGPPAAEAAASSEGSAEAATTHHVRAAMHALWKGTAPAKSSKNMPAALDEPKAPTLPLSKIAGEEEQAA